MALKHTTPAEDLANVERALREIQHRVTNAEVKIEPRALFGMALSLPTFIFAVIGAVFVIVGIGLPVGQTVVKFWLG